MSLYVEALVVVAGATVWGWWLRRDLAHRDLARRRAEALAALQSSLSPLARAFRSLGWGAQEAAQRMGRVGRALAAGTGRDT